MTIGIPPTFRRRLLTSTVIFVIATKSWVASSMQLRRYEDHVREAGFRTEVVPNQGVGAARMRIEAVRRILPRCHFDQKRCEAGLEALAWYHERVDDHREVGLGPLHDWSSHAADAFGLMAVAHSNQAPKDFNRRLDYRPVGIV
jgi:phage terminase large subunit